MPVGVDYRDEMPTYTDSAELEAARVQSALASKPPPAAAPPSTEELVQPDPIVLYQRLFGGFDRVPIVVIASEELASRELDARASMLLALLDGRSSIQTILDIGIVNALDTLAGLAELLERGVIGWKDEVPGQAGEPSG